MEVTVDKSLEKATRKRLQIEHAPYLTPDAKVVELADKISNVSEVVSDPPKDWPKTRKIEYLEWTKAVVDGLRGVNPKLEKLYEAGVKRGRQVFDDSGSSPSTQASPSA